MHRISAEILANICPSGVPRPNQRHGTCRPEHLRHAALQLGSRDRADIPAVLLKNIGKIHKKSLYSRGNLARQRHVSSLYLRREAREKITIFSKILFSFICTWLELNRSNIEGARAKSSSGGLDRDISALGLKELR